MPLGKKETIEKLILDYLVKNPDAADTAEGIMKFWMQRESAGITSTKVSRILEKLLKKGLLQAFQSTDGTLYYKFNKDPTKTKQSVH